MPIPIFALRIKDRLNRRLYGGLTAHLAVSQESGWQLQRMRLQKGQVLAETQTAAMEEIKDLIVVLNQNLYLKVEIPVEIDEFFDEELWLEENHKKVYPPGTGKSTFYTITEVSKASNRMVIYLIAKSVMQQLPAFATAPNCYFLLTEATDPKTQFRAFLDGDTANTLLVYRYQASESILRDKIMRWVLLIVFLALFGVGSDKAMDWFYWQRSQGLDNQLLAFQKEQIEYKRLTSKLALQEKKIRTIQSFDQRRRPLSRLLFNMVQDIDRSMWIKELTYTGGKVELTLYCRTLDDVAVAIDKIAKVPGITSVTTQQVAAANARQLQREYGVYKPYYQVHLNLGWAG
jgi:Tfp pilus assembly protein PilN